MVTSIPRLVIAAPTSGQGKTTFTTGLMAALSARGRRVAPFKVGPDYIDPGYHTMACRRPGRNLDPVLCGEELVGPLFAHGAQGCDIALVEGVMGLFDGRLGTGGVGSTAQVATLIQAPVVLVVDVAHTSRSAAAIVAGMTAFDPQLRLAAVVLNKVGSSRHEDELRQAMAEVDIPVLAALPRNLDIEAPSRHLGLVPAAERDDSGVHRMGEVIAQHCDLDLVERLAQTAPPLDHTAWDPSAVVRPPATHQQQPRPRVAIAGGRAFTFRYPETDELLRAAGCDVVVFDPLTAPCLPEDVSGLWLGGGFPEVHAHELASNTTLLADIGQRISGGLPTVAECAGLLYLCQTLDGDTMVGALDAQAAMTKRLTMGYRAATSPGHSLLGRPGETVTGHEFHRTMVTGTPHTPAWVLEGRGDGFATDTLHASYLHVHWAGHPQLAQRFADAVHAHALTARARHSTMDEPAEDEQDADLAHHGDRDLAAGLLDFAVNVRRPAPPRWLMSELTESVNWAAYPNAEPARLAIADHHGLDPAMVLPVAGAAEAFTLIARAVGGSSLVIHPQFTEPEAALRAAGRHPHRHLLAPDDHFILDPGQVPPADLVMVGNPTNPTAVLHAAQDLRRLRARVLVVDEAFLDAIPGQPETMIAPSMDGRLVLRSLTKTWALAGIRAGYVVGDPTLIAQLAAQQPPWSVSTPAVMAMVACLRPQAAAQADELALEAAQQRADLVSRLGSVGLTPVPGQAPFVLVNTSAWSASSLREPLARRGIAARRGETFPGLGPTWLRLAVRDPERHQLLTSALAEIKEETCPQI